jgi:6-hydroxynicotinate reductase
MPSNDLDKITCNACPVLCQISPARSGACDRYANVAGVLTRVDPLVLLQAGRPAVPFPHQSSDDWPAGLGGAEPVNLTLTGVGAGTTYPDYKPAPFIVASQHEGVDTVTVVTEGIFSYCSFRIKIDTDRWLGPERALVRHRGEAVGHVTTHEYGSQFLSLGGVHHLTAGSKREGKITCDLMVQLGNKQAVELEIEGGAQLTVQSNRPPIVNGHTEQRMRVGCGSATIGIFARQWHGLVDEVVVVDDHITGVMSEHQAGRGLNWKETGLRLKGKRSTPGRYFQVAEPGSGWGGTNIVDPLSIIDRWDPAKTVPGTTLLMVSTTGDDAEFFILDDHLVPQKAPMPSAVEKVVQRIGENCEPALATVLYVGGAGGSLRAGVTDNPILLTRSIKSLLTKVTCGGAPAYIWPGGGITVMVDVALMPDHSFGYVPTPALVSPIEFTMRADHYAALGGHVNHIRHLDEVMASYATKVVLASS